MKHTTSVMIMVLAGSGAIQAQYLGLNLRGDIGLKSGSQPEPGIYVNVPLFFQAKYDSVRGADGRRLSGNSFNEEINLLSPALAVITKWKLLGAPYGFQVVPLFMNQRINAAQVGIDIGNNFGWSDSYYQPVNLGWKTKHADLLAGYGFFAPTGVGARSLDMWAHEMSGGATVYFDGQKKWHVAGTAFYEIHQTKQSEDVRVGDILTVEGGGGRSFMGGAINVGAAYMMQWKTTDDSGSDIPLVFRGTPKNKAYGVGPELDFPVFIAGKNLGAFGFRYTFETGNTVNFQGNNLLLTFTLARFFSPF